MSDGIVCPKCGSPEQTKVSFTWWGGALGPKLLNHVKCSKCGTGYNAKTGQSNTNAIIIYSIVLGAIAFAVAFALAR